MTAAEIGVLRVATFLFLNGVINVRVYWHILAELDCNCAAPPESLTACAKVMRELFDQCSPEEGPTLDQVAKTQQAIIRICVEDDQAAERAMRAFELGSLASHSAKHSFAIHPMHDVSPENVRKLTR